MNDITAIEKRVSRRDYLNIEIDREKVLKLKGLIKDVNERSGLSISFVEDGSIAFDGISKSYGMCDILPTTYANA